MASYDDSKGLHSSGIRGDLTAIGEPIPAQRITEAGQELLGGEAWARFFERGSADVSVAAVGMRCRISLFRAIRGIPTPAPAQPQQPEITIDEDIDLNGLAELARKVEERTR